MHTQMNQEKLVAVHTADFFSSDQLEARDESQSLGPTCTVTKVRNGLPQNLQLSQLVWSAETVWLVEFPSGPHGLAASYYDKVLDRQLGDLMESPRDMKLNTPNQPSYEPDSSFRPKRNVPGIQAPPGMVHEDWVTVILEILYAQSWASVLAKVNVYRQRAGVEYIICIRMSELLNNWTYELHDVRDQNPVVRHHFDFRGGITDAERAQHVVELEAWRVLGLPQPVPVAALPHLPDGRMCPGTIGINMVQLTENVRE